MSDPQELYNTLRAQTEAVRAEQARRAEQVAQEKEEKKKAQEAKNKADLEAWALRTAEEIRQQMQKPHAIEKGRVEVELKVAQVPAFLCLQCRDYTAVDRRQLFAALSVHFPSPFSVGISEEQEEQRNRDNEIVGTTGTGKYTIYVSWARSTK